LQDYNSDQGKGNAPRNSDGTFRVDYSNKEILNKIHELGDNLLETISLIKEYNGLWEDISEVKESIDCLEDRTGSVETKLLEKNIVKDVRAEIFDNVLKWGGWLLALGTMLLKYYG